jgi:hypothetical protein
VLEQAVLTSALSGPVLVSTYLEPHHTTRLTTAGQIILAT